MTSTTHAIRQTDLSFRVALLVMCHIDASLIKTVGPKLSSRQTKHVTQILNHLQYMYHVQTSVLFSTIAQYELPHITGAVKLNYSGR
jgi:hypothetical protein